MVENASRYRDDEPVADPAVTVDAFAEQTNASAVRIEPGDDARISSPHLGRLSLVEVNFPAYTDGRGYSAARISREHGYAGESRAVGDVSSDQLSHMRRCGFDSFAPNQAIDRAAADKASATWPEVYQKTDARAQGRRVDGIDTAPRFTETDASRSNNSFRGSDTQDMSRGVRRERSAGDLAVVSSVGAESAVSSHSIA
ncbi:hypothetical protein OY671_009088, partial [Metschnikowia pulcherrima]